MPKKTLLEKIKVSRRQLDRYLFYFERGADGEFVPSGRPKLSASDLVRAGAVGMWSISDLLIFINALETRFVLWYRTGGENKINEVLTLRDLDALVDRQVDHPKKH